MTVIAQCIQRADCLEWDIIVVNKGEVPFDITMGLHNYFDVSSLKNVVISGPFSGASTLDRNANTEGTASRFESAHKTAFFNFKSFFIFFQFTCILFPHAHSLFPSVHYGTTLSVHLTCTLSFQHLNLSLSLFLSLSLSHTLTLIYISL